MKRFIYLLLFILSGLIAAGCTDELKERLENLENRVSQLEEVCNETNANLSALQAIVTALQNQIRITEVEQLSDGYIIHFSDGTSATIKDGKDSDSVPVFGVRKDVDGIYYWTLDGEWLKDEQGNKVRAQGNTGDKGETGAAGITPQLKIENDYWFVSYDNGKTWSQLGNATGEGSDCIFKSVTEDDDNVYFTLSDNTVITIPKGAQGGGGQGDTPELDDVDDVCEQMDDLNFMSYCYENFDVNHDSKVSMAEANAVSIIECNTAKSFKGIEYFTNLESFSSTSVETVDFGYNRKLTSLSCAGAPVTVLDLKHNTMLTSIGERAFYGCKGLTSVTFPESLTSIGASAFSGCESLTSVTFPEGLTSIGASAFSSCESLTSVTFPEGLTSIGASAFSSCESLTSVTFPDGLTSIGENAFYNCKSLTSVTFPEGLTSIREFAFYNCKSLTSVTFNSNIDCNGRAFWGCKCIFYGYGVTSDNMMYAPCYTLKCVSPLIKNDVIIPSDVTSIGEVAFYNCKSLTSVTFPEGLTSIGASAFYGCKGLTSVDASQCMNIDSIDNYAFEYCPIKEFLLGTSNPPSFSIIFSSLSDAVLKVPAESVEAYKNSDWARYFETIEAL